MRTFRLLHTTAIILSGISSIAAIAADESDPGSAWIREDISVFRDKFLAVDLSFTPETRAAAEARLEKLEQNAASIRPTEFVVELCRIAALGDNAHTGCLPTWLGHEICRQWAVIEGSNSTACQLQAPDMDVPDFKSVPIGFRPFLSNFHVVSVREKDSDLLGARLVAVDGTAIENARQVLRSFSGGTVAVRDFKAAEVLASPERLHAVALSRRNDSVRYELLTTDGRRIERTFEVDTASGQPTMHQLPDVERAPLAFQERNEVFRFRDAPDLDAVVIQLRQNVDSSSRKLDDFLREAEARRAKLARTHVVLDMRFNGGGNLMLTRDFMAQWPSLAPGRFYVLTSGQTFSAAIASIAYLKQAGGDRVVIVGESVGDRLMFFSDGRPVQLPRSGLFVLPAPLRMDFHDGCRKYDDCFAGISQPGRPTAPLPAGVRSIKRMPLSVESLQPDVVAPWTVESWLEGTDPMLEAVESLMQKQK